jgi:hypothetical protein
MLGQRIDTDQRLVGASAVPVRAQLDLVLAGPLQDQSLGTRRKPAIDQLEGVDRDLGDVVAVLRWKCGGRRSLKYIVITMP